MTRSFFATFFCLLLLAAPAAHASGIDLVDRLERRLQEGAEQARQAETPAQKRLALSEAFRAMKTVLERAKKTPGLSDANVSKINDLRREVAEQHDRVNGLNGYAPVPDADLDRFGSDVQQNLLDNRTITIGLGTAALIVLIIILLA